MGTQLVDDPPAKAPSGRLGRYDIVKCLAIGELTDLLLVRPAGGGAERPIVIKQLHEAQAKDARFREAFVTEARRARVLRHDHIVQVQDVGEHAGKPYVAMEYVHGEDLRRILTRLHRRGQTMPAQHLVTIGTSVAAALHHAHEQLGADGKPLGLVHHDVTPTSILVGYDGSVKVTDFGIAKAAIPTLETRGGGLNGKVPYLAPEQCTGQGVDRRSDVFALGVVLYELATARRLFKNESSFLTMATIVSGTVPRPSQIHKTLPDELERIILKALAQAPADRYQTADELRAALVGFAATMKRTGSPAALASYMTQLFGERPVPWLDAAATAAPSSVDFDGSTTGLAQVPAEAGEMFEIPDGATSDSPIAHAHAHAVNEKPTANVSLEKEPVALGSFVQEPGAAPTGKPTRHETNTKPFTLALDDKTPRPGMDDMTPTPGLLDDKDKTPRPGMDDMTPTPGLLDDKDKTPRPKANTWPPKPDVSARPAKPDVSARPAKPELNAKAPVPAAPARSLPPPSIAKPAGAPPRAAGNRLPSPTQPPPRATPVTGAPVVAATAVAAPAAVAAAAAAPPAVAPPITEPLPVRTWGPVEVGDITKVATPPPPPSASGSSTRRDGHDATQVVPPLPMPTELSTRAAKPSPTTPALQEVETLAPETARIPRARRWLATGLIGGGLVIAAILVVGIGFSSDAIPPAPPPAAPERAAAMPEPPPPATPEPPRPVRTMRNSEPPPPPEVTATTPAEPAPEPPRPEHTMRNSEPPPAPEVTAVAAPAEPTPEKVRAPAVSAVAPAPAEPAPPRPPRRPAEVAPDAPKPPSAPAVAHKPAQVARPTQIARPPQVAKPVAKPAKPAYDPDALFLKKF